MSILTLIYLVALGLCTWFGPKVVAVLEKCDVRAEVTNIDALAGFIIGVIPFVNIFFVFYGAWLLSDVERVLKDSQAGSKTAIQDYNRNLRDLNKNTRG